jgi:hypothetical protein
MPEQTPFANIATCRNQKDAFTLVFKPSPGADLTGAVVICNVLGGPNSTTAILVPTVETVMVGVNLEATFSWTQAQSAMLPANGTAFTSLTSLPIEVDVAFADDTTHPAMRFVSNLVISPGGRILGA